MNIVVFYDTRSGRTADMARAMGRALEDRGHTARVVSIATVDPADVVDADLLCAGCPTHGLFIVLQHPTREWQDFVGRLPDLAGKRVVVFTTYLLATGGMLRKMSRAVEARGGRVVGQFKARDAKPGGDFAAFVAGLG